MEVEEYLNRKNIGYANLSEIERKTISNFALVWSLFEARLLEESASARKIVQKSQEWVNQRGLTDELYKDHLDYFKTRYVKGDELSYRFAHLNLRKNDNKNLVKDVLLGNDNTPESELACCLIIALRFRNNYFHGAKWAYQFREQQDNLENSCSLLTSCLDTFE